MKYHFIFILLLGFGLNQAFGQLFIQNNTRNFIGVGLNSDPGKPIELRYARITPQRLGNLQLKLAPGYKIVEAVTYPAYYPISVRGTGTLFTNKMLKFVCIEPGLLFPRKKQNFRRSFMAFNFPMCFTQINTYKNFWYDPLFDNQLRINRDPKLHFNISAEIELLWSFNISKQSYVETGISLTIPIIHQALFGEPIGKFSETNYVPGAAYFPFINFSCSYNFAIPQ